MHHLQVAQDVAGFAGAVVERAARKLDHFVPPSDKAGFGPVMMEEFSLSLTRRRRGVFFDELELHRVMAQLQLELRRVPPQIRAKNRDVVQLVCWISCTCGSIFQPLAPSAKAWPTSMDAIRLLPLPPLRTADRGSTV